MASPPDRSLKPGQGAFESAQIVILSSIDWNSAWQRHQIFAAQFAEAGHEVFFVENTAFRGLRRGDLSRVSGKLMSLAKPKRIRGPNDLPDGLRVIPPTVLPPTGKPLRALNSAVFIPRLMTELRRLGVREKPVVVVYMPTATTIELARRLNPSMVVYDCASHFAAHPDAPPDFDALESDLLDLADLVVTDSPFLFELMGPKHGNVVRIHQGVPDAFLDARPPSGKWESFCYYGTWGRDLDAALVNAVADQGLRVVFSGFIKGPKPPFARSVARLKPVAREKIVERVQDFDAFLMPYSVTPFHKGVIPAKLYECFAMGRPIIATPLPSLLEFKDLLYIAETPEEWAAIAKRLPETETPEKRRERVKVAREHTYSREFSRLDAELRRTWDSPPKRVKRATSHWISATSASFLENFPWVAGLFAAARASTLLVQFLAARALGPADFGEAHLIYGVAAILQVLPMLGFPVALARFGAAAETDERRTATVSSTLLFFFVWAVAVFLALRAAAPAVATMTGLETGWGLCLALSFLTAAEHVVGGALQGLCKFRQRGVLETIYGATSFAVFGLVLLTGNPTVEAFIASYLAGLGAATAYGLWQLRAHFRPGINLEILKGVLPYALLGTLGVLSLAMIQAPGRIAIFHQHSAEAAGIYSAYFTATAQASLALVNMIHTVLIPLASRPQGQRDAWATLGRHAWTAAGGSAVLFCAAAFMALTLLGSKYPLHAGQLLVFAATASLILMHGIASALFAARDLRGLSVSVAGTLIAGVGNLVFNFALTPRYGVLGAGSALLIGYAAGLLWYARNKPRAVP